MRRHSEVAREDLLTFINAAFTSTGQAEFHSTAEQQLTGLAFLHEYVRGNYRRLYALLLAAGINDFNTAEIIFGLLKTGAETEESFRELENSLLRAAARSLPPHRWWKLVTRLRLERVNNRRTRALIRDVIAERSDLDFQAMKYRRKVAGAMRHIHYHPTGELSQFLFGKHSAVFETPEFERYRQARYSKAAVFQLPYSVALGLAAKHGIDPDQLRSQGRLTERERLRTVRHTGAAIDPRRMSLTELASYVLAEPKEFHHGWLEQTAQATVDRVGGLPISGRVAAILDNSYSTSGSRQKRNRPLAVAWGVDALLRAAVSDYRGFWTNPVDEVPVSRGQTNLAERLIDALEWGATTVLVVSDGVENDPPQAFHWVLERALELSPELRITHVNPVFDPLQLQITQLSSHCPAVGLRYAEQLPMALGFADYAAGGELADLEAYLLARAIELLGVSYA